MIRALMLSLLLLPASAEIPQVPRELRLAFGRGLAYAEIVVRVRPAEVGQPDWRPFDRDGDGRFDDRERQGLVDAVRRATLGRTSIAVGERVLPVAGFEAAPLPDVFAPDASLVLRLHAELPVLPGPLAFTLYDVPPAPGVIVPARVSVGPGWRVLEARGGRVERKGDRRVEAPLSRSQPVVWGIVGPVP